MAEILIIQAEMEELARVGNWVDGLVDRWGLPQSTSFAIQLCFEEAVSNVILHNFHGHEIETCPSKNVRLAVECESDAIIVTIEDHGIAFDPLDVPAPAAPTSIDDAAIGGLGIHLMRQFAQHIAYERRGGANRLTLRFDLAKRVN
jgi:anti-sigma regulatory factor (Ser/Thr protein kinase)